MIRVLNSLIKNNKRRKLIERKTKAYGKYEIKENEIACYVEERKLERELKNRKGWIAFLGIFVPEVSELKSLNINKPFHYIIENITFDFPLFVRGGPKGCYITFRNCTFEHGINISNAEKIILDNNKYQKGDDTVDKRKYLISMKNGTKSKVKELKIINTDLVSTYGRMYLEAEKISIKNAILYSSGDFTLEAKELHLYNADVDFGETEIKTNKIISKESHVGSSDETLKIESDYIENLYVTGKNVIVNDEKIGCVDEDAITLNIDNIEAAMQIQRQNLVGVLKQINKKCDKELEKVVEEKKKEKVKKLIKTK